MPLFNPSTISWANAVKRIADSAGASGDGEMQVRAHYSLRAAFQRIQGKANWDFLRTETTPIGVVGQFSAAITASGGTVSATALGGHGLLVDDIIVGANYLVGTRVTVTAASGFFTNTSAFSTVASAQTITATRDYYDMPSDWKMGYSVRMLGAQRVLTYMQRRFYDRGITDEYVAGTPLRYDLFSAGGKGKIRLLPPPVGSDVLLQRYYRRFTLASASSHAVTCDIPEDYEETVIALAKWHFLVDKGEGRKDQATTWFSMAQDGLKSMLRENSVTPDEDLGFVPAGATVSLGGDNSTRNLIWDVA
jgi:hypothetical protein